MFIAFLTLISSLIVFIDSRPVRGENILTETQCTIDGLLGRDCRKAVLTDEAPARTTTKNEPTQQSSAGPQPATSPSDSTSTLSVDSRLLAPLPATEPEPRPILRQRSLMADQLAFVVSGTSRYPSATILGTAEISSPVAPTESGWLVFGVPWYVLLLGGGAATVALRQVIQKSRFSFTRWS